MQLRIRHTSFGDGKAGRKNFAADQTHSWKPFVNPGKHKTSSATNLEEAFGVRKIITKRPLNELIPRAKPKIRLLNLSEPREIFGFESGVRVRRFLRELIYLIAQAWLVTALRTCPVHTFKESFTREASFHPLIGRKAIWASTAFLPSVLDGISNSRKRHLSHSSTIVTYGMRRGFVLTHAWAF